MLLLAFDVASDAAELVFREVLAGGWLEDSARQTLSHPIVLRFGFCGHRQFARCEDFGDKIKSEADLTKLSDDLRMLQEQLAKVLEKVS